MAERRTFRDEHMAKNIRNWNNRFPDPLAVREAPNESNTVPTNHSAQTDTDRAHAFDQTRWGDPAAFMQAQIEQAPYILNGVEHTVFSAVAKPISTEA